MMCNINSTPRKSLDWKTPYEIFVNMFGKEALDKLGIYRINSKDIILIIDYLKKKNNDIIYIYLK